MLFNYLSTDNDRREWVEAVRVARDILNQPAFAPFNDGELSPGPAVETDEEILDWVREDAETALHPSCTAKMGIDEMSVIDPASMQVHGVEGLRVVDATVFPYVTNGNIYAPVMMVAEKAADLILGNTPLPPADVPYYRHRDDSPLYPPGDSRNQEDSHDRSTESEPTAVSTSTAAALSVQQPLEDLRPGRGQDHRHPGRRPLARRPEGEDRLRRRGQGRLLRRRARRGLRGDGPLRLRQVDAGALPDPADRADLRHGPHRRRRRDRRLGASCASCDATTCRWCSSTSACCRTGR